MKTFLKSNIAHSQISQKFVKNQIPKDINSCKLESLLLIRKGNISLKLVNLTISFFFGEWVKL